MALETLVEAAVRYRLRNRAMRNEAIAIQLGAQNERGDSYGFPRCCFFRDYRLIAIRLNSDDVAVFPLYRDVRDRMAEIGDPVVPDEPEETHL